MKLSTFLTKLHLHAGGFLKDALVYDVNIYYAIKNTHVNAIMRICKKHIPSDQAMSLDTVLIGVFNVSILNCFPFLLV